MDPDFNDEILTFDELLEDDYYKSEFEARVKQRPEEYSHSDLKGGNNMNDNETVQTEEPVQTETAENAVDDTLKPLGPHKDPDAEQPDDKAEEEGKARKNRHNDVTAFLLE